MGATLILRVTPHPTGDWIVQLSKRRLAVSPALGGALLSLSGGEVDEPTVRRRLEAVLRMDAGKAAEVAGVLFADRGSASRPKGGRGAGLLSVWRTRASRRRALWLRVPLVSAGWTAAGAYRLRRLTSWPGLAALAGAGAAGYAITVLLPPVAGATSLSSVGASLALFLLTALWHEFGHAAALAREGYPPGGIGAGVLFVLPVLFADVTLLGALPRHGRLRVDIAGVCFQFAFGGGLCLAGTWWPPARTAGWIALLAVGWSLLPFIRSDGYWALGDLLGVSDLRGPAPPGSGRGLRFFLRGFRIANGVFLALVVCIVAVRAAGWFAWLKATLVADSV